MRKTTQTLLLTGICFLFFAAVAGAQTSNTVGQPPQLSRKLQEEIATRKPHHTPLAGANAAGVVIPKAVAEAMKNHASRPASPPATEAEKRKLLQDKVRQIMEAKRRSGSSG